MNKSIVFFEIELDADDHDARLAALFFSRLMEPYLQAHKVQSIDFHVRPVYEDEPDE